LKALEESLVKSKQELETMQEDGTKKPSKEE